MSIVPQGFVKVGTIGVDAGLVMVCDPCYPSVGDCKTLKEAKKSHPIHNWGKFCNTLEEHDKKNGYPTAMDIDGINGVVVSSGYGDGCYNVYVRYSDEGTWGKRVAAMMVVFIGDEDDSEE